MNKLTLKEKKRQALAIIAGAFFMPLFIKRLKRVLSPFCCWVYLYITFLL